MKNERISIIIPCRNEEKYLGECIQSFIDMDYENDKMEILVVDGDSRDNTLSIVREYQNRYPFVRLINNPKRFTPNGLNLGIENAKSEYIMIASAHSTFSKEYLKNLFSAFMEFNADAAGGIMVTDVKNRTKKTESICKVFTNKFGVGNSMFRVGTKKIIEVDTVPFGIYRKKIFDETGLYNEALVRNHDIELSKRIISYGKKIILVPSAKCIYFVRETFSGIARNNFGNGFWNILTVYVTKKLNSLSIRHFIPLFFILSLIIPVVFMIWYPPIGIIAAINFAIYLLTVSIISLVIKDNNSAFFYILWGFLSLHFSYGFGSLIGLFRIDYLFRSR